MYIYIYLYICVCVYKSIGRGGTDLWALGSTEGVEGPTKVVMDQK